MRAGSQTTGWIREYYTLIDAGRLDECERFFAPNASLRIAHHPPVQGWEAISSLMRAGLTSVLAIRHEVVGVWEEEDGIVISEVEATYTLHDQRTVVVPGAVVAVVAEGRFIDQRLYADLTPVFG